MSTTQDLPQRRFVKMPMSKRHRKESTSGEWRLRALRRIVAVLAAALTGEQRSLTCEPPRVLGLAASVGASAKAGSRARGGVHRLRVLCGLAPVACGVLLMLAALPAEALASTNWATGVEASLPANARTNPDIYGLAVSCASAGNCTAVGSYFDSSGHLQGVLLSETSGTWATGVQPSLPANAGTSPSASVYRVSCASAGNCTAVGGYTDGSGHSQGLLLTETSGTWATGVEASLPANANANPNVSLDSVSCVSAGNCTAVGNYNDSYDSSTVQDQGLLLTETSGTWATGVDASLPGGAGTAQYVVVQDVSCASEGNCTAVGQYEDSSFNFRGLLLSETSGTWAAGVEASLPAGACASTSKGNGCGAGGDSVGLGSVSCASAGNCSAVGGYADSSGHFQGLLLSETSGTWAAGVEASLPANANDTGAGLGAVSCASAGNCTAVGGYEDSSGHGQGMLLSETSGTWATGVEAALPANANTSPNASVFSVSCASAGNCSAVGEYEDSSGHYHGLLLSETSAMWATGVEASLPANAGKNPDAHLDSVSCASAGNCTAVGSYTDSSGHEQGLLLGTAPSAASALALIGRPTSKDARVTDKLSCAPSALLPCRATETLTTTETTRSGRPVAVRATARRQRRTVIVATKRVMIHPGRTVTVTVKLNTTGRKLLARFDKLPVTLNITLLQNGGHLTVANTKLTVKPKKKRPRRAKKK